MASVSGLVHFPDSDSVVNIAADSLSHGVGLNTD